MYFEVSISAGAYINEYINGNTIFSIDDFIDNYRETMFGTKEFQNFIVGLKKYNKNTKRKIDFYGIDLEFQKDITKKVQEYLTLEHKTSIKNRIMDNQEKTTEINALDEKNFEIQREAVLLNNFVNVYKSNSLCYLGAWHIRQNSNDENFVKNLVKQHPRTQMLAVELLYKNSKRTVQDNKKYKIINVNDEFNEDDYHKYGDIFILKADNSQGVMVLENCINTKMLKNYAKTFCQDFA